MLRFWALNLLFKTRPLSYYGSYSENLLRRMFMSYSSSSALMSLWTVWRLCRLGSEGLTDAGGLVELRWAMAVNWLETVLVLALNLYAYNYLYR